jgi:hypothetical protein
MQRLALPAHEEVPDAGGHLQAGAFLQPGGDQSQFVATQRMVG